ncbi:MAG: hypothetical protein JST52_01810 [Bacteroidetes bacterium]|nr:hypothetical protein [Bacteroidota bacterium]MBS1741314.1 hypothetical protein [Bacteroidota bacterium]MBS1776246.1 hypothetical protein [Bacteroidota bacterium]
MLNKTNLASLAAIGILTVSQTAFAQDASDALRYSMLSPQGTARSMGFGNALGSVGGDFTSLSVNPAGIGIYRKSEFMFTPSLRFGNTTGSYLGTSTEETKSAFNFSNIGMIFTRAERGKRYDHSAWKAVSFGIGLNRLADFNRNYSYGGLMKTAPGQPNNSFSELFVNDIAQNPGNGTTNGTLGYLGYQTYLVNQDSLGYYTLASSRLGLNQARSVSEKGGLSELLFSLGGNYQEKLMLGMTVGIPTLRYSRDAYFQETDASGNPADGFGSFRYTESLRTSGIGINLKLGMILKPSDYFRFGLAVHTPTWFSMKDTYDEGLTANTENYKGIQTTNNDQNLFNYNLSTPWRGIISATGMMGKYGFITADYEYVDYSSMHYSFANDYKTEQTVRNNAIKSTFQAASNFRIGIEGRLDAFAVRAGFGYYGNPYKNGNNEAMRKDFSLGLGFRGSRFFTDVAFVHSLYNQTEIPYSIPASALYPSGLIAPTATLNNSMNTIALTIGWKM